MNKYPLKKTADHLASKGRYGDTVLVHMNPAEVEGIASLSPTGELTINPDTGQPEAFLPFLAPLLGGMLGSSFIPGLAASAGIGGLSTAAGGAIGSGLANWAATGDLEKGLMSGLMGYGIGNAFDAVGAAGGAADIAGNAGEKLSKVAVPEIAKRGVTDALGEAGTQAALQEAGKMTASAAAKAGMSDLAGFLSDPAALAKGAMSPGAMVPIATGAGMLAEEERLEAYRDEANRRKRGQREGRRRDRMAEQEFFDRNLRYSQDAFPPSGNPYSRYAGGGITDVSPETYAAMRRGAVMLANGGRTPNLREQNYGLPGSGGGVSTTGLPAERQAALRGPYVNAPPEDYRPGFDPEFLYFSQEPGPRTTNPMGQPAPSPGFSGEIPPDILSRYELLIGPTDLPGKDARRQQDYLSEVESLRSRYPGLYTVDERLGDSIHRDTPAWPEGGGAVGANVFGASALQPQPVGDMQLLGGSYASGMPGVESMEDVAALREYLSGVSQPYAGAPTAAALPQMQPQYAGGGLRLDGGRGMRPRLMADGGMTSETGGMMPGGMMPGEGLDPSDMEMVALAIRGEVDGAEQIIEMFTEKYGPEVFAEVRESVLQTVSPGAQTEGMLRGEGSGMQDGIAALIGSGQPAAVSPGEFIVPADVVSGLGDGSSDSGAERLQELIDRVRESRTGTTEQPSPIAEEQVMPA